MTLFIVIQSCYCLSVIVWALNPLEWSAYMSISRMCKYGKKDDCQLSEVKVIVYIHPPATNPQINNMIDHALIEKIATSHFIRVWGGHIIYMVIGRRRTDLDNYRQNYGPRCHQLKFGNTRNTPIPMHLYARKISRFCEPISVCMEQIF